MSFADNLRMARKERNVSQEGLAEILNVSRQAVSKWEQGTGYPEMETIILLAKELNTSLDHLASGESTVTKPPRQENFPTGKITIKFQDGKMIVNCYKVVSFPVSKGKDVPNYALFGIDSASFLDENRNFLGWYTNKDAITKEIDAILKALEKGEPTYKLRYYAKVKKTFLSVKLDL